MELVTWVNFKTNTMCRPLTAKTQNSITITHPTSLFPAKKKIQNVKIFPFSRQLDPTVFFSPHFPVSVLQPESLQKKNRILLKRLTSLTSIYMPGNRFVCAIQKSQILWPLGFFYNEKSKLLFEKKQVPSDHRLIAECKRYIKKID